jgi:hypothetical protein
MDESEEDDFYVTPCNCKGTSEYVHFSCLKFWIQKKTKIAHTDSTSSIVWKKLQCEICKIPFPKKMMVNGEEKDLVKIERPEEPYIMLESHNADKGHGKGLHILKFTKNTSDIKIGRGH